jgi:hypothetical protein
MVPSQLDGLGPRRDHLRTGLAVPGCGTTVEPGDFARETRLTAVTGVRAVLASDEHADAIAEFNRESWGDGATREAVLTFRRGAAAANVVTPGEAPPMVIVLEGRRVVACCGSIPHRLWDGATPHPAYWVKGLMVLPEYRRGPLGFLVLQELVTELTRATGLVTALAAAPAARRLFRAVGCTDLGAVPNFLRPLRPARLARRLNVVGLGLDLPRWVVAAVHVAQRTGLAHLAGAGGVILDLTAAARRRAAGRLRTGCAREAPPREELDDVWRGVRGRLTASPVRDGLYLRSRFGPGSAGGANGNPYTFITAREGARLVGVAVMRRPRAISDRRLQGICVATISDIVFPPERADVGLALLGGVERAARAAAADAILCSTGHRAVMGLLRRQAYVPLPGNMHFFLRDTTGAGSWPQNLASWWLARGDDKEDETL